jgi:hypothetical protein
VANISAFAYILLDAIYFVCSDSFIFTVQLRLDSPGLLHVKKIEE